MRTVAIVPARGGSKGLPRKNLRTVGGVPLVVRAVDAARAAATVDAVWVSTEDAEIAAVAREAGAEVVDRPPPLATDDAQGDAVLRHALEHLRGLGWQPAVAVLLQPTSPLRRAADIDGCIALFHERRAASVFSLCAAEHHPGKAVVLRDGRVEPFTNERDLEARRQDMAEIYRQNGAVYVVRVADFLTGGRLYRRPCFGYVMDRRDSIDIDDETDLRIAEVLLAAREETE